MDLELRAMEEENGWMSRKHGIDIRRKEVELQIMELKRDELRAERRSNGEMIVLERGPDAAARPDVAPSARRKRIRAAPVDVERPSLYQLDTESRVPSSNIRQLQGGWKDKVLPGGQQLRKPQPRSRRPAREVEYIKSSRLPDRPLYPLPHTRPHHKRSPSPNNRPRYPSPPAPPRRRHSFPKTTAIVAGSLTALRIRHDEGPWLGKKAVRIAASAGTAALTSLSLDKCEIKHREGEDGLMSQIAERASLGVAVPVMAGIGAERIFWDREA